MNEVKPPIKSGWRGKINGHIEGTEETHVKVGTLSLVLDYATAWALCNMLTDSAIKRACAVEGEQVAAMSNLGAALGRMIDHSSANNGGRQLIK